MSLLWKVAAEIGNDAFYHRGVDPRQHTSYVHVGTRAAAGQRHDQGEDSSLWRVHINPQNPLNHPHKPLDDGTANMIGHLDANRDHLGRMPQAHELDPDFEDAPDAAGSVGWKPEHDAIYYRNEVEDPGSISAMVRSSAISHVEPVRE
jgi:hypothetical protein